jgi:hypothetical protein
VDGPTDLLFVGAHGLKPRLNHRRRDHLLIDGIEIGDAAGLAYAGSGEGIRPAIESGLLAAATIVEADGQYTSSRLQPYQQQLEARFGPGPLSRALSGILPAGFGTGLGRHLLAMPAFVRHVVVDRWFLHRYDAALTTPVPART